MLVCVCVLITCTVRTLLYAFEGYICKCHKVSICRQLISKAAPGWHELCCSHVVTFL